jgi:hypothetical protein
VIPDRAKKSIQEPKEAFGLDRPIEEIVAKVQAAIEKENAEKEKLQVELGAKSPETIRLADIGDTVALNLQSGNAAVSVFVRDQGIVTWDAKAGSLTAINAGSTEIYAIAKNKMHILPVKVGSENTPADLGVPSVVTSIEEASTRRSVSAATNPLFELPTNMAVATPAEVVTGGNTTQRFSPAAKKLGHRDVLVKVVDERSQLTDGRLYPVANAQVRVAGSSSAVRTNQLGQVVLAELPLRSRVMLSLEAADGSISPGMAEVVVQENGKSEQVLRVLRSFTLDALTQIIGIVQESQLGSLCANVEREQDGNHQRVYGLLAGIDAPSAVGPFYFNQLGFLDKGQTSTGADGRVCIFNIPEGPALLTLAESDEQHHMPIMIFAGRHQELTINLSDGIAPQVVLASLGSAHQQLSSDLGEANSISAMEYADITVLGTDEPLSFVSPGRLGSDDPYTAFNGRVFAYVQAPELEPLLVDVDHGTRLPVITALPRGFVEDMAILAQSTHDPELGAVVVEYSDVLDQPKGSLNVRLIDAVGNPVGTGWYYSDVPLTKAVFFNVPSGKYQIIVETKDGFWLQSDTVFVYDETVSFKHLGSPITYRP